MNTFPLTTVESCGQIKDDARAELVRLWDERTQWARLVDRDGYLFDGIDAFDAFNEMLDSTHPTIQVAGVRISPHMALWAQASDYKYKQLRWLGDLIVAGELREVVDDER